MTNRKTRFLTALCGGVAVLGLSIGGVGAASRPMNAMNPVSSVAPASVSPGDTSSGGGAVHVHPAGGGGCYLGLNCGPINTHPQPSSRIHLSAPPAPPHPAPGPRNP